MRRPNGDIAWSRVLAWVLTIIIIPSGAYAANKIITTLDTLSETVQRQEVRQAELNGKIEKLEAKMKSASDTGDERRDERNDDISIIRTDVKEMMAKVHQIAIAVNRLQARSER